MEKLGYKLSRDEMNEAYEAFITIADKKKVVVDEDLIGITANGLKKKHKKVEKKTGKASKMKKVTAEAKNPKRKEAAPTEVPSAGYISNISTAFVQDSMYDFFNRP